MKLGNNFMPNSNSNHKHHPPNKRRCTRELEQPLSPLKMNDDGSL